MDLAQLLDDTVRMWADKATTKRLAFELARKDCPAWIVEDGDRLRQILFNLIANALKFTEEGSVQVSVSAVPGAEGERLQIQVRDTGIGIAPDQLGRIFESFTQVDGGRARQYGGTGLGLAISRKLARALGGDIRADSIPGEGSTFTLDLPLTRAAALDAPEGAQAGYSVLVLEDNPLHRALMKAMLEPRTKALRFVATIEELGAAQATDPADKIVIDGACVARHHPEDPVSALASLGLEISRAVVLWPNADAADLARVFALGPAAVLTKPVPAGALMSALDAADPSSEPQAERRAAGSAA